MVTHTSIKTVLPNTNLEGQRLDVWLFRARFFKTRSLSTKMIKNGKIRLTQNGRTFRAAKPHTLIRPGDNIAFMRGTVLIQVKMDACATRRGPAHEARTLYQPLNTPQEFEVDAAEKTS